MSHKKPVAVHRLEGTYRPDRHGGRASGVKFDGRPAKPKDLSPVAERFWDLCIPELEAAGLLGQVDEINLVAAAKWLTVWSDWLERSEDESSTPTARARAAYCAKSAWQEYSKISQRYGLCPISRDQLRGPQETAASPLLQLYHESKQQTKQQKGNGA